MLQIEDDHIEILDSLLPPASGDAFAAAREHVLASGQSVLQSANGFIYEVFPDGRGKLVMIVDPPTSYSAGSTFNLP